MQRPRDRSSIQPVPVAVVGLGAERRQGSRVQGPFRLDIILRAEGTSGRESTAKPRGRTVEEDWMGRQH